MRVIDREVEIGVDPRSLDEVRGVLFASANRGEMFLDSVSTQSIRFALARRGRNCSPVDALHRLYELGDVQSLGRGRWVPCTTTIVAVDKLFVVLSGMPSRMLERVLKTPIFGHGACRLIADVSIDMHVGSHTFEWWCGAPRMTAQWTTGVLRDARMSQDVIPPSFEYFNHWDRSATHRWSRVLPHSAPDSGIVLAREKGPVGTLYFLCELVNRKADAYQEFTKHWTDAFRLGFGLRTLAANASTYECRDADAEVVEFVTPKFLPSPERKVLSALGEAVELEGTSLLLTKVPVAASERVEAMLGALGLANRTGQP